MTSVLRYSRSLGLIPQGMHGFKRLVPVVFKFIRYGCQDRGEKIEAFFQSVTPVIRHVQQSIGQSFIDPFSTNAVVPVVGWVEAIAETHHIHPPFIDGFRCALPILRGLGGIRRPARRDNRSIGDEPCPEADASLPSNAP